MPEGYPVGVAVKMTERGCENDGLTYTITGIAGKDGAGLVQG
jgi:hypothetical protein